MIEKLSLSQEILLQETIEKWLVIGRSTLPINITKAESIINRFYKKLNIEKPNYFIFSSPLMCILGWGTLEFSRKSNKDKENQLWNQLGNQLWNQLGNQLENQLENQLGNQLENQLENQLWNQLGNQLWNQLGNQLENQLENQLGNQLENQLWNYIVGNQWCYWKVFYSFVQQIGVTYSNNDQELLNLWMDEATHLHWWFPYEKTCLISQNPIRLTMNSRGQLHADERMAIEYSDGWGLWSLNGVIMPEQFVKTPAEQLDPNVILKEKNVEIRRELIRKMGIERCLNNLDYKTLDKRGEYELLNIKLNDTVQNARYLKMLNPSIGTWHLEGVEGNTVQEALNWRAGRLGIKEDWNPSVLT